MSNPVGYYVYGWYHGDEELPFHIGQGRGRRAWDAHNGAACSRLKGLKTKVVIFKDRLTKEGALFAESILIDQFRRLGAPLTNQATPLGRSEVPPLALDEDTSNSSLPSKEPASYDFSERNCSECSKTFKPNSGRQRTCSRECGFVRFQRMVKAQSQRRRAGKKVCPTCGQVLRGMKGKKS